jgi:hypothetical protein
VLWIQIRPDPELLGLIGSYSGPLDRIQSYCKKSLTDDKNVILYMKVVKFSADPGYINVRNGMSLESCGSFRNLAVHAVPYGTPNPITYSYNLSFFLLGRFSGWIRNNMESGR